MMKKMLHVPSMLQRRSASGISMVFAVTCVVATTVYAQGNTAAGGKDDETPIQTVRTNSPRDTLETFLRLAGEAEETLLSYWHKQTRANAERARLLIPQFLQLIDLSSVPSATRKEVGSDTVVYLLDIIGRVDLPPMESVPGADATSLRVSIST